MKKLLLILLLLTSPAFAQHLIDQDMRDNSGNRPWIKTTTETAGDGRILHSFGVSVTGGPASATAAVITYAANTASGSIAAGCTGLTLIASSDFAGTVGGQAFISPGGSYNYPLQAGVKTPAVAFTRTAGTLYSVEIR